MDKKIALVLVLIAAFVIPHPYPQTGPVITVWPEPPSSITPVSDRYYISPDGSGSRAEPVSVWVPPAKATSVGSGSGPAEFTSEVEWSDNVYAYVEDKSDNSTPPEYIMLEFPDLGLVDGIEIQSVYILFEHHEDVSDCGKLGNQNGSTDRPDDLELWNGSGWMYIGDYTLSPNDQNSTTPPTQTKNVVLLSDDPVYVINHMKLRIYIGNENGNNTLYIDTALLYVTYIPYKPPAIVTSIHPSPQKVTVYGAFSTTLNAEFTDENNIIGDFIVTIALRGPSPSTDVYYLAINAHSGEGALTITETSPHNFTLNYTYDPPETMEEGLYDLYLLILDGEGGKAEERFEDNDDELNILHNHIPTIGQVAAYPPQINKNGARATTISILTLDPDALVSDFSVSLSLRHTATMTEYNLYDNATSGSGLITITAQGNGTFNITYILDPDMAYPNGSYDAYVWLSDGISWTASPYSLNKDVLSIFYEENIAPDPPSEITPQRTSNRKPLIQWNEGYDPNGDPLSYEIRIGTSSGGTDVLAWYSTGAERKYQVITSLDYRTYYVGVRAFDGEDYSEPFEATLEVVSTNNPPGEVPAIYPETTSEKSPRIWWLEAVDSDGDPLRYEIRIGTTPGGEDVLSWSNVGYSTEYYPTFELDYGTYYVGVRAFDGIDYGPVHEESINVIKENMPPSPPNMLTPTTTDDTTPTLKWTGASDTEGEVLGYFIAIGQAEGYYNILPWIYVTQAEYTLSNTALPRGQSVYVTIRSYDGELNSTDFVAVLRVEASANTPPMPHTYEAEVNIDPKNLTLPLPEFTDLDKGDADRLDISIALGTSPNGTDIMDWTEVAKKDSYTLDEFPGTGNFYLSVRAKDIYGGTSTVVITIHASVPPGVFSTALSATFSNPTDPIDLRSNESYSFYIYIENNENYAGKYEINVSVTPPDCGVVVELRNGSSHGKELSPLMTYVIGPKERHNIYCHIQRVDGNGAANATLIMNVRLPSGEGVEGGRYVVGLTLPVKTGSSSGNQSSTSATMFAVAAMAVSIALIILLFILKDKIILMRTRMKAKREAEIKTEIEREIHGPEPVSHDAAHFPPTEVVDAEIVDIEGEVTAPKGGTNAGILEVEGVDLEEVEEGRR